VQSTRFENNQSFVYSRPIKAALVLDREIKPHLSFENQSLSLVFKPFRMYLLLPHSGKRFDLDQGARFF